MVTELRNYIDVGGSYREGIFLLRKCAHNLNEWTELAAFADKTFAPTWAEKRLDVLLRQYCTEFEKRAIPAEQPIPQKIHKIPQNATKVDGPGVTETVEPPVIVALRQEEREARTARRAIHLTLDETKDRKLVSEKVQSVRAHTQRIDEIWNILGDYEKNGTLPALGSVGDERDAAQEVDELHRKMKSITPRISRLKGFLKDDSTPLSKIERYKRELSEKEAEMKLITQKLATVHGKG